MNEQVPSKDIVARIKERLLCFWTGNDAELLARGLLAEGYREIERLQRNLTASQDRERQLVQSVETRDRELDEARVSHEPPAALRDVAAKIIETCRAVDGHANHVLVSRELMGKLVHAWEQPCTAQPPELPRVTPEPQPSSEDVRDAERYRLLRGGNDYQRGGPMVVLCEQNHIDSDDRPFWSLAGEALDSEVDRLGITKGDGQ